MIFLLARQLGRRASASTCVVLRSFAFIKQQIWLFYPVLMIEKEVKKWWSLLSSLIIYCYCLQRLVSSLKFVNTKYDDYLLRLYCTEVHVTFDE